VKPNHNWLPLTLYFDELGPFTAELNQFSSMLIGYYFFYQERPNARWLLLHSMSYGRQQCHTIFDQIESDRQATHTETEGHCFICLHDFSGEIHLACCILKEIYETQSQNINILYVFVFWGSLDSLGMHEYTTLERYGSQNVMC
jgi:hypothetical protein